MDNVESIARDMYDAFFKELGEIRPHSNDFFLDSHNRKQIDAWLQAAREAIRGINEILLDG